MVLVGEGWYERDEKEGEGRKEMGERREKGKKGEEGRGNNGGVCLTITITIITPWTSPPITLADQVGHAWDPVIT